MEPASGWCCTTVAGVSGQVYSWAPLTIIIRNGIDRNRYRCSHSTSENVYLPSSHLSSLPPPLVALTGVNAAVLWLLLLLLLLLLTCSPLLPLVLNAPACNLTILPFLTQHPLLKSANILLVRTSNSFFARVFW